ncbi:heterogeneous nuclear ribonucleoprotein A3 like protein 2-like [Ditylenchus destructor]|nr:heterogeneous nuclear ribonucleoprotein A3 like protein 2-like [Ditylenchus destructor]
MVTNKIVVSGPRLHPGHEHPRVRQRTELRKYFEQFGKIVDVTVVKYDNSTVTFDNCESAAKCIQQRVHNIRGQDFFVKTGRPTNGMKNALKAQRDGNVPGSSTENASIPNSQIPLPGGLTNRIFVVGPCLRPEKGIAKANQKEAMRSYFGQFGQICGVSIIGKKDAKVAFDNCDSAARCIQQRNHIICGHEFIVHTETPSNGMKDKIRANLRQNMSGPSSENVSGPNESPDHSNDSEASNDSAPNIKSEQPAESHLGNQALQGTTSSSSQVQGGVIDYRAIPKEWSQSYGLASFDKPGSAASENVSAPVIKSDPAAESNIGNQALQAPASSSSQVQGSVASGMTQKPWHKSSGLSSFDKPG